MSLPILLCILCLGTAACVHPGPVSVAPSPPPSGWWVVETARAPDEVNAWTLVHDLGVPGAAWRFTPSELDAVRPGYLVDRVALVLRADGAEAWRLRDDGPQDDHVCRLQRAGAGVALRCAASDALITFRLALPEEAQSAEHALAQHGSAEAACARAAGCAALALETFPYLGEYAPHGAASLRVCEAATLLFAPVPPDGPRGATGLRTVVVVVVQAPSARRVQAAVRTPRQLVWLAVVIATLASCHAIHPLEIADACRCSPGQYCHVRPPSSNEHTTVECLPMPGACTDPPTCACLGRPIDACREELGAFTVIEPRAVNDCGDCATEEYCWHEAGSAPLCRLLPARCEEAPTCACLTEARALRSVACNERHGRIEASLVQ